MMNFRTRLSNYLGAAYPCVAVQTCEEARLLDEIMAAAKRAKKAVLTWSATEGIRTLRPGEQPRTLPDTQELGPALVTLRDPKVAAGSAIVLRDAHTWPWDRDPVMLRAFRDLLVWGPQEGSTVVMVAPEFRPHPTVERLVTVLDFALPGPDELREIADKIAESCSESSGGKTRPEVTNEVVRALSGLTVTEAENALSLSFIETNPKRFDPAVLYREKVAAVRRSGLLEVIEPEARGLDAIGGLDNLKTFALERRDNFTPEAAAYGLDTPRALCLVGVPGGGKSLAAKCIGTAWNIPTLKLDIGALFNSLVGESEARCRDALRLAEALAPCIVLCDEADKSLAGSQSGAGDSGVARRVFGTILTWLQEKTAPAFVIFTMNQVDGIPPELLRAGRLDALFAVDLPDATDRAAILRIHLAKRRRDPDRFDCVKVAEQTEGFTGSEIEQIVKDGMQRAFSDGRRETTTDDLTGAAAGITPLSVTSKEQIDAIRAWARTRARFASRPREGVAVEEAKPARRLVGVVGLVEETMPATVAPEGDKGSN